MNVTGITAAQTAAAVSPELKKAAEGFERLLLGELTKTIKLAEDTGAVDLSQTFADVLAGNGGLGLAAQLQEALRRP